MRNWTLALVLLLVLGGGAAWLLLRPHAVGPQALAETAEVTPAALHVTLAVAASETFARHLDAFGTVEANPRAMAAVAWPAELIVKRVLVVPGQTVAADEPLLEVALSPDAQLQAGLAKQDVHAAEKALTAVQSRFALNLATQQEKLTADAALATAEAKLARALQATVPPNGFVRATAGGVVRMIAPVAGGIAPAGSPLVTISRGDALAKDVLRADIGVDPREAGALRGGESVELHAIDGDNGVWRGTIDLIQPTLDPISRLRRASVRFTAIPAPATGSPVRARIELPGDASNVVIPRTAVLPTAGGDVAYVIHDGLAERRSLVTCGREDVRVCIRVGVKAGEAVATSGVADLTDGARVLVLQAKP
jgi:RND family efflux transporter MFP subunit